MKRYLLLAVIAICLLTITSTYACGCGIAIVEKNVFNQLKETEAYLLVDVTSPDHYEENVFFKFISMSKPENIPIIFPLKELPTSVTGQKISPSKFKEIYGFNTAESEINMQNFGGVSKEVFAKTKEAAIIPTFLTSGFSSIFPFLIVGGGSSFGRSMMGGGMIAHYEFEGGTLDIYNASSGGTMNELIARLGVKAEGGLKDLVDKYGNYYIAVLNLSINSAIKPDELANLEKCAPKTLESVKSLLKTESDIKVTGFGLSGIQQFVGRPQGRIEIGGKDSSYYGNLAASEASENNCNAAVSQSIINLISAAVNPSADVEGNLVVMKFDGSNFFYPISVVNSYDYPITKQSYFIKTPQNYDVSLESSKVNEKAIFEGSRWYKITYTKEDLEGKIVEKNALTDLSDSMNMFYKSIFNSAMQVAYILTALIVIIPLVLYLFLCKEGESLGKIATIVLLIVTGFWGISIYAFLKKKYILGFILAIIWGVFLGLVSGWLLIFPLILILLGIVIIKKGYSLGGKGRNMQSFNGFFVTTKSKLIITLVLFVVSVIILTDIMGHNRIIPTALSMIWLFGFNTLGIVGMIFNFGQNTYIAAIISIPQLYAWACLFVWISKKFKNLPR